ncbi:poly(R)-hydroxyalkanoic acid synthase subunit PhaE [Fulvimonas yonginensis]|uniref:Poly(3-hydroxyalkanoate) polymerase subunit PhaE n=2 Tax=Fulvimonas yonginensis TaxID=1495200 RepID=A0ABU8JCU1_9GAMM
MPGAGAVPPIGLEGLRGLLNTPAFGYTREQQAEQQALLRAMLDHQQASARYQQLLARAQAEGAERLQRKLAEPGFQAGSLKAMYDLWVDAAEEAYAEIALSDEFREAYAAQANTQMRLRQLQQRQVEQWCREMGLPTRSEVATLGQRLQELRRELRRTQAAEGGAAERPGAAVKTAARRAAPAKPAAKAPPAAKNGAAKARSTAKAPPAAKATTRRAPRRSR